MCKQCEGDYWSVDRDEEECVMGVETQDKEYLFGQTRKFKDSTIKEILRL